MTTLEARDRADIFVAHGYPEQLVDLGEIRMNYATVGSSALPALLLVPAQVQSWWGYEEAMALLAEHFQVFSVDLRGQGRSTQTPGRYTLDNMGNDLVRFIDLVIGRPRIVSGNSSGGVLAAWLSAYAKPGQVRGSVCEDPPLFSSELTPACGHSIRQVDRSDVRGHEQMARRPIVDRRLGGHAGGAAQGAPQTRPGRAPADGDPAASGSGPARSSQPPQNMKEYDPEWGRLLDGHCRREL